LNPRSWVRTEAEEIVEHRASSTLKSIIDVRG
jgi:hypothetical protein